MTALNIETNSVSLQTAMDDTLNFIDRAGGRIAYRDQGHGPVLFLIHGLGDTVRTWRHLTPRLVEAGYRVIAMHLRGCGQSDASFLDYDAVTLAKDALAVLDDAHVDQATVVGCSLGGAIAAWMAAEAPQRIRRLVFLNAFVRDMPSDPWIKPVLALLFANPWGAWMWKQYWKTLSPTVPADLEEEAQFLRSHLSEPGRLAALRAQINASKAPVAARLAEVVAPTLIVMGECDPDYNDPAEEGQIQSGLLGGPTTVRVIGKVGHYPQVEATEQVFEALLAFERDGETHGA